MKKMIYILAALAAGLMAAPASAQFAKNITWGATVPFIKIPLDTASTAKTSLLAAGAGMSFMANLAPSQDGRWRMVTFAVPVFVSYDQSLSLDAGLTLGTFNNILSVGIAATLSKADVDGVPQAGVFSDGFTRENTYVIISASLNFGGGGEGSPEMQSKLMATAEPVHTRPPGYVGW